MHRDFHFLSMHIRNHCKEIKITVTRLSGMSTVMVTTKKTLQHLIIIQIITYQGL